MPHSPPDARPLVCVLGIDTVREKLLYQTRWLAAHGIDVDVLTMHRDAGSIGHESSARIVPLRAGAQDRVRQVVGYLRARRQRLHHVELYVGGRFAAVLAVLCRLLRVPVLVVERGDLMMCRQRLHPLPARLSIYASYALATRIWFKEPYMAATFRRWRPRASFFLPNGVPIPTAEPPGWGGRDLDLLWANRIIPQRRAEWLAEALASSTALRGARAAILGFSADGGSPLEARVRELVGPLPEAECAPFTDPEPYYRRARFFVLAGDVVFGNFSLLESMSHGVVPIVTDGDGVRELIDDGVNGFVVEHRREALTAGLERARAIDEPRWAELSRAARATVEREHGIDGWGRRLLEQYAALDRPGRPATPTVTA